MSSTLERKLSHETASTTDGASSSSGDGSADEESIESKGVRDEPHPTGLAVPSAPTNERSTESVAFASENSRRSRRRGRSVTVQKTPRSTPKGKIRATPEYLAFLNNQILSTNESYDLALEPLPPSKIGASFWSSHEKACLFAGLSSHGSGELKSLATCVGTKSEPEVHVYLRLLQDGARKTDADSKSERRFAYGDVPAADEVGAECEAWLDQAADDLGAKVWAQDVETEREKFGGDWLVNDELATRLDADAEAFEAALIKHETAEVESTEVHKSIDGESQNAQPSESEPVDAMVEPHETYYMSSSRPSHLLAPSSFLHLSRTLFMHQWQDLDPKGRPPAIFRTAFSDFENLVVSLTRRLLQVTLFQATSRLRASDSARANWTPKPDVLAIDVATAAEILGLPTREQRDVYWTKVARRCGVQVLVQERKWRKQGRPGAKGGVKLTYEEVEAELGLTSASGAANDAMATTESVDERYYDSDDSDLFTLADFSEHDDVSLNSAEQEMSANTDSTSNAKSADGPSGSERDADVKADTSWKRKRWLSPRSHAKAEDAYLEALDARASTEHERKLWEALQLAPPVEFMLNGGGWTSSAPVPLSKPLAVAASEKTVSWRSRVQYMAEWERGEGVVNREEFVEVEKLGHRGRKRRKLQEDLPRGAEDLEDEGSGSSSAKMSSPSDSSDTRSRSGSLYSSEVE